MHRGARPRSLRKILSSMATDIKNGLYRNRRQTWTIIEPKSASVHSARPGRRCGPRDTLARRHKV
eukprot:2904322-Pleurochrysis_carterae.AAC.5